MAAMVGSLFASLAASLVLAIVQLFTPGKCLAIQLRHWSRRLRFAAHDVHLPRVPTPSRQ